MPCHGITTYLIILFLVVGSHLDTGFAQDGEGTFDGVVYSYFPNENLDFNGAENFCKDYTSNTGGLAELTSDGIKTHIASLIIGNHEMWIGSTKIGGSFTWMHAQSETAGVIGAGNGKDCVYYRNAGQWKAAKCTDTYGAICSRPSTIPSTSSSTTATPQPTTASVTTNKEATTSSDITDYTTTFSQTYVQSSTTYQTTSSVNSFQTTAESTSSTLFPTFVVTSEDVSTTPGDTTADTPTTLFTTFVATTEQESTTSGLTTANSPTTLSTTSGPTTASASTTVLETAELPLTSPSQQTSEEAATASVTYLVATTTEIIIPTTDSTTLDTSHTSALATTLSNSASKTESLTESTPSFTAESLTGRTEPPSTAEWTTTRMPTTDSNTDSTLPSSSTVSTTASSSSSSSVTNVHIISKDTATSPPSHDVTTDSGRSTLLSFLLHQRRPRAGNVRAAWQSLTYSTVVPTVLSILSAPSTQIVTVRSVDKMVHRKKRDDDDQSKDCREEKGDKSRQSGKIRDTATLSATSSSPLSSVETIVSATMTESDGSTTSSKPPVKQNASTRGTVTPVVTTPVVTTPPTVVGNVSQVIGLTQDTSSFNSHDFVMGIAVWLAANDEIPDDLDDDSRLEYAKNFFDVCNNVFAADLLALGETDAASNFANACSHLAQDLTSDLEIGESVNISTTNVHVYASVQKGHNFTGFTQVIEDDNDNDIDEEPENVQVVIIPSDIVSDLNLSDEDSISVSVVVYKRGHFIVDHDNESIDLTHRPAGSVVSITVAVNDNVTSVPVEFQLENDVSRLLPDERAQYEPENISCVFWDSQAEGAGQWNDFGCKVLNATREFTVCSCNHTTHFGVLLQVREIEIPPADDLALTVITYIGAGISIACLIITILILNLLTSLTSDRVKIHKNLVTALVIAQGLFLSTDVAARDEDACKVITLFLHYFYLSVFCWSLLEGLNLYIQIVQVFSTGKTFKYIHYLLIGWGLPIPIVAISAGIRWDSYGTENKCWLTTNDGLIWAFAGPVSFVITTNLIILCMVVRVIVKSASAHKSDNYDHVKAGVKGALLLVPILGLGWVFGFLSLSQASLVFTYLFVLAVALQGILIFLLYCAFNAEVRAALKRKNEKRKLRRGDGLISVPTPSSINTSQMQSNETSTTFASKLIERIKRRRSSTTGKNSPVDTIRLVDRRGSAHTTRDIILHARSNGSIDSGYDQHLIHTPRCLPSDSMASIRTEALPDEFIPPNTPTYDNEPK